jgi:hypothetical protein
MVNVGFASVVNTAPVIDLNGPVAIGIDSSVGYTENAPATAVAPAATVTDADSPNFDGGSLSVVFSSGGQADDQLVVVSGGSFLVDESDLYYQGNLIGTIGGGVGGGPLFATFNDLVTPDIAAALIRAIGFVNYSDNPGGGTRTLTFTLTDGDGGTSNPANAQVTVTPVDDPAVALDDSVTAVESSVYQGSVFADNGHGQDSDPDGSIQVTAVNNQAVVGQTITLPSGALLRVNADGTFRYNANGKFNLASSDSGAVNTTATDSFTYTINGGDTATVTVTVTGDYTQNDTLKGDADNNVIVGSDFNEFFDLRQGGVDNASGLGGNDIFFFAGTLTSADIVDGGDGTDTIALQGNYGAGLTLTANVTNIEAISLLSGASTRFGEPGTNRYDYNITVNDANFTGGIVKINGGNLLAGEDFTFNGAAEDDARFLIYGGFGQDNLTGGQQADIFFFDGGTWQQGDKVVGGGGYDALFLRGNYTIDFNAAGWVTPFTGIENITVTSVTDTRYASGGGGPYNYTITFADALLAAGETLTVNAGLLLSNETLSFDGHLEASGSFRLFGGAGADTLTGGGGNDLIYGGLGADTLAGGGGADVFRYDEVADSVLNGRDTINGFTSGTDKIDLSRIDANALVAGDQAFKFGTGNFTGAGAASAGELRVTGDGSFWIIQGDTDGDGGADFLIFGNSPGSIAPTELDFYL